MMNTKEWISFLILSLAWGSSFFGIKIAIGEVGPFTLVALWLLLGALGLLAVVLVKKPKFPRKVQPWLVLALLGLINVAVPFTLISWGEMHIDSAVGSILNSSVPLFTAVLAHFLVADDRLSWQKGGGLLIGFGGVLILILRDVESVGTSAFWGQVAVLLSAVLYAISAIIIRRWLSGISNIVQAFGQVLAADIFMWMILPFVEAPFKFPVLPKTWLALIWLGLVGSCVAYLMYFYLINNLGPTRGTQVSYTFPVVGILFGTLFLGESFDLQLVLGAALIIGSILIVNWQARNDN